MRFVKVGLTFCILILMIGCIKTVGEIKDNKFFYEDNFSVDLLDDEWQVLRQQMRQADPLFPQIQPARYSSSYQIRFAHKKSNGFIGVDATPLTEVGKQRSLDVLVDAVVSKLEGVKLSQKKIMIGGIEAVEVVQSSKEMMKVIIFKTSEMVYYVVYTNTPSFFDTYLPIFDKFMMSLKVLKS
jgi:hypothetical protein